MIHLLVQTIVTRDVTELKSKSILNKLAKPYNSKSELINI